MDYKKVTEAEADFKATGKGAGKNYELTPFSIPVPGDNNLTLDGVTCRPQNGFEGYYYDEKITKKKIVLHFTVGHLKGDILSLTDESRGHVSTAFVVARDGTPYQLFSSAAWSYHLGRNALGGNAEQSKISIGIEISNYGPLIRKGNNLETAYSSDAKPDVYCTLEDTEQYIKLSSKFRGYEYYAAFTNEQYHSIIILLRYLTKAYNIPRTFVSEGQRFTTSAATSQNFSGICTHINFRSDKVDIGPAFDWERVISGVTAATYGGNPLEDAVKVATQQVEAAKQNLETAKNNLSNAEAALVAAQDALDASEIGSRNVTNLMTSEPKSKKTKKEVERKYSSDGPEPFDIDKSPFYL